MRPLSLTTLAALAVLPALGRAQADTLGYRQYPQFRGFSGLPGGGYGVLASGRPSIEGAAALATPIGYTLSSHGALSIASTSFDQNPFRFDTMRGQTSNNGSFAFSYGSSFEGWHGSAGFFLLSTHGDSVFNFQVSPPLKGRLGVAVGVQDIASSGGASNEDIDLRPGGAALSRSFYGVGTYDFGSGVYGTLGFGDVRWKGFFGNASAGITKRLRGLVEFDGFNFNGGLLYGTGRLAFLNGKAGGAEGSLFLGTVRGKYGAIGFTLTL